MAVSSLLILSAVLVLYSRSVSGGCVNNVFPATPESVQFTECDRVGDTIEVYHLVNGANAMFGVRAKHSGYVAVGFPKTPTRMVGALAVVGYPDPENSEKSIASLYNLTGESTEEVIAIDAGLSFENTQVINGNVLFTVTVPLAVLGLTPGQKLDLIWSLGPAPSGPSLRYHSSRGDAVVTLAADTGASTTPSATPTPSESEEPSPSGSSEPSEEPNDDSLCFPADATVELRSGEIRRMDELALGDEIRVGGTEYGTVFLFSHREASATSTFVSIETALTDKLVISPSHYVMMADGTMKAAGNVQVGDAVVDAAGNREIVRAVELQATLGLYAPHTTASSGTLVVSGYTASEFTTAVHPALARALLAPLKAMYKMGLGNGIGSALDGPGALRRLRAVVPRGPIST